MRNGVVGGPVRVLVGGREYPLTLSTSEVATLFQCSAELLQRQVGTGLLPCEPLRLGNRLRWPTVKVAAAVGFVAELVEGETTATAEAATLTTMQADKQSAVGWCS